MISTDHQMFRRRCILLAAVSQDGIIGLQGSIPWKLPSDLRHFKKTTMGGILVMGRTTYESLPVKELPGRSIIVLSKSLRKKPAKAKTVCLARNWAEAEDRLADFEDTYAPVIITGGGRIYGDLSYDNPLIPKVFYPSEAVITWVHKEYANKIENPLPGDITEFNFPISPDNWKSLSEETYFENETLFRICRYRRLDTHVR